MKSKKKKWGIFSLYKREVVSIICGHIIANFLRGGFHGMLYFFIIALAVPVMDGENVNIAKLWGLYGRYALIFVLYMGISAWSMTNSFVKAYQISTDIRLAIGDKLRRLPLGFFKRHDPGDLTGRMLGDVEKSEHTLSHAMPDIASSIILPILLGGFLLFLSPVLGFVMIGTIFVASIFFFIARSVVKHYGKKMIEIVNQTSSKILEYSRCIKVLKAYDMVGDRFTSLDDSMKNLKKAAFQVEVFTGIPVQLFLFILDGGYFFMVFASLYFYSQGMIVISDLLSFVVLGHFFYAPVKQLGINLVELRYALMSQARISELMNEEELTFDEKATLPESEELNFNNVRFGYKDSEVLKGISCTFAEKSMTALVGLSGSGKTTITSLIARFWEASSGGIAIGTTPINRLDPDLLLSRMSMVFQDVYLFNNTIRENIKVGNHHATDDEIFEAAKKASCHDFITALPQGYDTIVGEGGGTLSGGEKQRISIARAILKDAPIVLLDEATASLDPENESEIQRAIENLVQGKTIIVIAHRFKSIVNADKVLVIHEGTVHEEGTHSELIQRGGLYQSLWEKQQKATTWKIRGEEKAEAVLAN